MGASLNKVFTRIFDYPMKTRPICFYRQEDFDSTGRHVQREEESVAPCSSYNELVTSFYRRLLAQRQHMKLIKEKDHQGMVEMMTQHYPGWNEMTVANLHTQFLLFDSTHTGMLGFDDFYTLLESLGDESPLELRKVQFDEADVDKDGSISYDEFLLLVYNYDPPKKNQIVGLAKLCFDIGEKIRFINSLSLAEQLECGLF